MNTRQETLFASTAFLTARSRDERLDCPVSARERNHSRLRHSAHALKIDPRVLTGEIPPPTTKSRESEPITSKSQLNFRVSDAARNALILVAQRFGVDQSQVIELAPFLFCWAAEESLRERREQILQVESACEAARRLEREAPHLPLPNFTYSEEKIVAEHESIDRRDLFGRWVFKKANFLDPAFDYDPDTQNPFTVFLRKLVVRFGSAATFEGWPSDWVPQYRICAGEAAELVGGDPDRVDEILRGLVALNEMPKEIRNKPEMVKERADCVRSQAEQKKEQQLSDLLALMEGSPT